MAKTKAKSKKSVPMKKQKAKPAKKMVAKAAKKSSVVSSAAKPKLAKAISKKTLDKAMHLSPVRSRVVIRRQASEERTAGGLFIPDTAKDKPLFGEVVAVGTGVFNKKGQKRPLQVEVGDKVLFNRYSGSQIELNGEDLLVVEESEILGIIQD
jgi:chaperonin GroES